MQSAQFSWRKNNKILKPGFTVYWRVFRFVWCYGLWHERCTDGKLFSCVVAVQRVNMPAARRNFSRVGASHAKVDCIGWTRWSFRNQARRRRKFSISNFELEPSGTREGKTSKSNDAKCSHRWLQFTARERGELSLFALNLIIEAVAGHYLHEDWINRWSQRTDTMFSPLSVPNLLSRFILLHVFFHVPSFN